MFGWTLVCRRWWVELGGWMDGFCSQSCSSTHPPTHPPTHPLQTLAKARAFLPSEQLEGMSRLAYSLELKSAFQQGERGGGDGMVIADGGGGGGGGGGGVTPDMDMDAFFDFHYAQIITNALVRPPPPLSTHPPTHPPT